MVESLLLAVTRVTTATSLGPLTNATGFFYEVRGRLFLVTNRHVVVDETSGHSPEHLEIELHIDPANVAAVTGYIIPLYLEGVPQWRETVDTVGIVDVVAIELERDKLPKQLLYQAFTPASLVKNLDQIEIGTAAMVAGFPLGFHDTFHHLPIARRAMIASSFGIRFQGNGYFLTDARMHRGTSGAPVVLRKPGRVSGRKSLPWWLLGIHASRLDVINRDLNEDERLNLNCAWYADVLPVLTAEPPVESPPVAATEPAPNP
ncbi:trypsin-like peptidase domain-containing protein [Luteolibacter ambystomatis]|uniref:Trypsin-like peptidase domain-containing protein n=1 Tax=Luteolibacter ambystomatis TaxID=2824561 RepID=A0A975IZ21_9BACT|nr:trypsin-like peptidase domain-containing protein [Luteolibacter ambystomatis]QUE50837.1 trypsin-like peptidase domain-containing protein [Luteolibacter ambystomatis]